MSATMWLLDACRTLVEFGANWFLRSSLLIGFGLLAARLLRRRGAAVQSVVYRTALGAVVLCPLAAIILSNAGFAGWSIEMPSAYKVTDRLQTPSSEGDAGVPQAVSSAAVSTAQPAIPMARSDESPPTFSSKLPEPDLTVPLRSAPASRTAETRLSGTASPAVANSPLTPLSESMLALDSDTTVPADVVVFEVFSFGVVVLAAAIAWIAITCVLLLRSYIVAARLRWILSNAASVSDAESTFCRSIAGQVGTSTPDLLRTPFLTSPLLHGIRRPTILLPDDPELSLQDVFVHELAHLKRRDCFWLVLKQLAICVLFYQPLIWLLGKRIDASAEEVCDDFVVHFGGDRERYASSLVDIATHTAVPATAVGMAMVSFRSLLGRRVARILDTSRSLSTTAGQSFLLIAVAVGLAGTTAAGFVGLGTDDDQDTTSSTVLRTADSSEPAKIAKPAVVDQGLASAASQTAPTEQSQQASTPETISGRVTDSLGLGVSGAKIWWFRSRVHDIDPMKPILVATSGQNGVFSFVRPPRADPQTEPASWEYSERMVILADGYAVLRSYPKAHNGVHVMDSQGTPLRGRIIDIDGQPVANATIRIRNFSKPRQNPASGLTGAVRNLFGHSSEDEVVDVDVDVERLRKSVDNLLGIIEPVPLRFAYPSATTDHNGEFTLTHIGTDWTLQLLLQREGIQSSDILAATSLSEPVTIPPRRGSIGQSRTIHGNDFLFTAGPSRPVTGTVSDLDNGEPIARAVVRAYAVHGERVHSSRERQHFATRTDRNGKYTITGLPIGKNKLVALTTDGAIPWIPTSLSVDTAQEEATIDANFGLRAGIWAEGRVTDGTTGKPFTGEISYSWKRDRNVEDRYPGARSQFLDGVYWTNINGEFRVPVLPVPGILAYRWEGSAEQDFENPRPIDRFPRGLGADAIEGFDVQRKWFETVPTFLHPGNFNFVRSIAPEVEAERVEANMKLEASAPIQIQIGDDSDLNLPQDGYMVYGLNERWGWKRNQARACVVEDLLNDEKRKIFVYHRPSGLGGSAVVYKGIEQPVRISLSRTGRVRARVFDKNGDLVDNGSISVAYEKLQSDEQYAIWASHPTKLAMPTVVPIDEDGWFKLEGLIPGWKYSARVSAPRKLRGRMTDMIIGMAFVDLTIESGENRNLGDVKAIFPTKDEPED